MRQRVQAAGLRVPRSIRAASRGQIHAFVEDCGLPIILKPVAGAGSADTWRVDRPEELDAIIDRVGGHHEVSCEEFVVGDELTYETVCIRGRPVYESVCRYEPNCLVARQNEWISPIIQSLRDLDAPELRAGVELGRKVLGALGMGTGFTHMEWFRKANGAVVFGEIACRPPGANMVDLMNYTGDIDLFREWARVVCWESFEASTARPWSAAIVFKRAEGHGRIRRVTGMDAFRQRFGGFIARDALAPVGTERRDWEQTFLSDGNVVVRHPDEGTCLAMARAFAATVRMYAG
jgi:biotin carboxylase